MESSIYIVVQAVHTVQHFAETDHTMPAKNHGHAVIPPPHHPTHLETFHASHVATVLRIVQTLALPRLLVEEVRRARRLRQHRGREKSDALLHESQVLQVVVLFHV